MTARPIGARLLDELHDGAHPVRRAAVAGGGRRGRAVDRGHARGAGVELRAAARHHQPGQAVRQEQAARHHRGDLPRPAADRQHQPGRAGPLDRRPTRRPCCSTRPTPCSGRRPATTTRTCAASSTPGTRGTGPTSGGTCASRQPEHCPTFAMAALAGIGALPDTITDRGGRGGDAPPGTRRGGRPLPRPPRRRAAQGARRRGSAHGSARHLDELRDAEPDMPVEDRAADTWEPLIAVADLAGGDWPARARKAAIALTAEDDTDTTLGARLLADLRDVFGDADAMHGETILERAAQDPRGAVGRLLRPADERPRPGQAPQAVRRRLRRREDRRREPEGLPPRAPARPVDPLPATRAGGSATSATSATAQVSDGAPVAGSGQQALPATCDTAPDLRGSASSASSGYPHAEVAMCTVCGEPLWPALAELGDTMHAACDPAVTP